MSQQAGFRHGDHICAIFDTDEEKWRIAVDFIVEGLQKGERCLYAGESRPALQRFAAELRVRGIDADHERARGALILLTKDEAHLVDGCFDSERMLGMLNDGVEAALNEGYAGLRTCGDMSWLLDRAPGSEQVAEYEALVTELFQSVRAIGMCQYDRQRLGLAMLDQALSTHPSVLGANQRQVGNPFYAPGIPAPPHAGSAADAGWKLESLGLSSSPEP